MAIQLTPGRNPIQLFVFFPLFPSSIQQQYNYKALEASLNLALKVFGIRHGIELEILLLCDLYKVSMTQCPDIAFRAVKAM